MYYASTHIRTPKRKAACSVVTTDGEIFDGSFFCSGDQRIKDLLNGDSEFLPFETLGGAMYLLNRTSIARVMPRGEPVKAAEAEAARPDALLS